MRANRGGTTIAYPLEKQQIEVIGRAKFTEFAILSGFELATPVRDCGIDYLLYFPFRDDLSNVGIPIQLKCYSSQALTVDSKYDCKGNILHIVIWNCLDSTPSFFALTQKQAMQLAYKFEWNKLPGWTSKNGRYDATKATPRIKNEMNQYSVNTGTFKEKIRQHYDLKKT